MKAAKQVNRFRFRIGAAAAVPAVLALALSGCSPAPQPAVPSASESSSAATEGSPAPAETAPELSAQVQAVEAALTELLVASPSPSREAVREAYVSAGFSPDAVEVSQDGTPTGLGVDSIVSAAPEGSDCIVGEIRGGSLSITTIPVLSNGDCLLGDDR